MGAGDTCAALPSLVVSWGVSRYQSLWCCVLLARASEEAAEQAAAVSVGYLLAARGCPPGRQLLGRGLTLPIAKPSAQVYFPQRKSTSSTLY